MKYFGVIIVLFLVFSSCKKDKSDNNGNTTINVELHHSFATNVFLEYTVASGEIVEVEMSKVTDSQFETKIDLDENINYLVNIKVTSTDFPDAISWVGKAIGIDAVSVLINGVSMTNDYLVKTYEMPSAAFSIVNNGTQIIQGEGDKWNPNPKLPPELTEYHHYCVHHLPPSGFTAALPWMQALHNGSENDSSKVEIDYLQIYAHTNSGDTLLYEDDYSENLALTGYDHGGTYLRYPFFFDEVNHSWAMPAEITGGALTIHPDSYKDRVFHWWTSQRASIPANAEYLIVESRVKITGEACVQLGLDFWKDLISPYAGLDVNNTEAGVSDFIFKSPTNDWQIIRFSTETLIPWED